MQILRRRFHKQARRPHFFKVIHQPSIRDGKLMIPVEFVRKFGEELPDVVVLKVPGGREWSIELEKIDGEYPDNIDTPGESNLRNKGPMLESEDRGRGIQISLGKRPASTWEIGSTSKLSRLSRKKRMKNKDQKEMEELPYGCELDGSKEGEDRKKRMKKKDQREMEELPYGCEVDGSKEGEDTIRVEQDEHLGTSLAERTRRPVTTKERGVQISLGKTPASTCEIGSTSKLSRLSKKKRMKNKDQREMEELPYGCELDGSKEGKDRKKRMKKKDQREMEELPYGCEVDGSKEGEDTFRVEQDEHLGTPLVERTRRPVTIKEREKAKRLAQKLKTERPSSFMVVMKPSYLLKGLNVPLKFAKKHFTERAHNVTLKLPDGRTWSVQFYFCKIKALLSGGWKAFVQENMLEDGDCCVFELLKVEEIELKVSIFRVLEKVVQPGSSATRRKQMKINESKATQEARDFKSENPFFSVYVHPSYAQRSYMILRAKFFKRHLKNNLERVIFQDADGRKWPIRCIIKHGQCRLGCGWAKFAKKNEIEEGNVCVFELIEKKAAVFKISIFRSH